MINSIRQRLADEKAIIILGARQAGKSTLLKQLETDFKAPCMWWNGDDADIRQILADSNATQLKSLLGNTQTLIIDEAQRIKNIGLTIKIIIDQLQHIKVIATGSSAFELANQVNEPLTGRKWEFQLFPIAYQEMEQHTNFLQEKRLLAHRLVYGSYPEIVTHLGDEKQRLKQLADSYLFKDILIWERIKKPEKLEKLLQALAFQVGSEVSYNELSRMAGLDNQTVEKYIQLLEKVFIIFRLPSFNRNLRNELKKSRKIYFYDNGLRNAVINQFNSVNMRNDIGALWENYLISERIKYNHAHSFFANRFFWRTHSQQEIDYLEEQNGKISAYEFKWNSNTKAKFPKKFIDTYQPYKTKVITPDNYRDFLFYYRYRYDTGTDLRKKYAHSTDYRFFIVVCNLAVKKIRL